MLAYELTLMICVCELLLLQVGKVIGKKRAALDALEAECRVTCDENYTQRKPSPNSTVHSKSSSSDTTDASTTVAAVDVKKIAITGSASACETARLRIDAIASSIEIAVTVSEDLAMLIRTNKYVLREALATEYNVRLDLKAPVVSTAATASSAATKQKSAAHSTSNGVNGNSTSNSSNSSSSGEQTLLISGLPVHVNGMVRKLQV